MIHFLMYRLDNTLQCDPLFYYYKENLGSQQHRHLTSMHTRLAVIR